MRRLFASILTLALCTLISGRQTQGGPADTGSVAGTIVTSMSWMPILQIRLCSMDRVIQTQSDQRGAFRFENVPPGEYEVETGGKTWETIPSKDLP